jgi:predicted metal-dependent hydrolase
MNVMADASEGLAVVVRRGVRLFNRGRYLSAQQIWEAAWVEATGDDRPFLESLVQLAGGLHLRTRRGGEKGAEHLLQRALATLEDFRPSRAGIDVDALLAEFGAYLDWIKEIRRPHRIIDALRIPRLR